jgi:hypothetical protein
MHFSFKSALKEAAGSALGSLSRNLGGTDYGNRARVKYAFHRHVHFYLFVGWPVEPVEPVRPV